MPNLDKLNIPDAFIFTLSQMNNLNIGLMELSKLKFVEV